MTGKNPRDKKNGNAFAGGNPDKHRDPQIQRSQIRHWIWGGRRSRAVEQGRTAERQTKHEKKITCPGRKDVRMALEREREEGDQE